MTTGFKNITCQNLLFPARVEKFLCTTRGTKAVTVGIHREFDAFTIRWHNTAEANEKRAWERLGYHGVPFFLIPDKSIAVEIAEDFVRLVTEGACVEAACANITRNWAMYMVEDWDTWSKDARDRYMRRYGNGGSNGGGDTSNE